MAYLVQIVGSEKPPTFIHKTFESAKKEQLRLANCMFQKLRKNVRILQIVDEIQTDKNTVIKYEILTEQINIQSKYIDDLPF